MWKMWYNEAKQIKFSRLITGKYFLFQMNQNEWNSDDIPNPCLIHICLARIEATVVYFCFVSDTGPYDFRKHNQISRRPQKLEQSFERRQLKT